VAAAGFAAFDPQVSVAPPLFSCCLKGSFARNMLNETSWPSSALAPPSSGSRAGVVIAAVAAVGSDTLATGGVDAETTDGSAAAAGSADDDVDVGTGAADAAGLCFKSFGTSKAMTANRTTPRAIRIRFCFLAFTCAGLTLRAFTASL